MDSRRRFRPRLVDGMTPQGTLELRRSGCVDWPSNRVETRSDPQSRRDREWTGQPNHESSGVDSREKLGWGSPRGVRTVNRHRWARRVASGERVKRGQGTRHNDPVTSEEGMLTPVLMINEMLE